jgi:hypothetical protein
MFELWVLDMNANMHEEIIGRGNGRHALGNIVKLE